MSTDPVPRLRGSAAPGLLEHWQRILELTLDMQRQAAAGDWVSVNDIEARRRLMMDLTQPLAGSAAEPERLSALVRQILDLDKSILQMGDMARRQLGNDLSDIRQGRKATEAYHRVHR